MASFSALLDPLSTYVYNSREKNPPRATPLAYRRLLLCKPNSEPTRAKEGQQFSGNPLYDAAGRQKKLRRRRGKRRGKAKLPRESWMFEMRGVRVFEGK